MRRHRHHRTLIVLLALAAALAVPASVRAAGINLSWDDCGAAGAPLKTFACDATKAAPATLIASFEAPAGVQELLGLTGELRVVGATLPDWWKHGAGQCRGTNGMSVSFEPPSATCADFWSGRAVGGMNYEVGAHGPNTARLRVTSAIPFDDRAPIPPEGEFFGFGVRVQPTRTSGAGACAGCVEPVAITLENIQLFQPPERAFDPLITQPLQRTTVHWQGESVSVPSIASVTPPSGAPGTAVTITGAHLDGAHAVRFGGAMAAFQVLAPTTIAATVPANARSGAVTVETAFGVATSPAHFDVAPVIRGFVPGAGPVGSAVTIHGFNFARVTHVRFGAVEAPFTVVTDSVITTVVPAGAEDGAITLADPAGASTSERAFVVGPAVGGLNLSWDDCGLAGAPLQAFACDRDAGTPIALVGSFVPPPGVDQLTSIQSQVRLSTGEIPDWWRFGPATCRGMSAIAATVDFAGSACADPWQGRGLAVPVQFDLEHYGPGTMRMRINTLSQGGGVTAVDPGAEYAAFKLVIQPAQTTACAGCDHPLSLTFEQARLVQATSVASNPVVTAPLHRNVAWWQAQPGVGPTIASIAPTTGGPGTTITILGENLGEVTRVRFVGRDAAFEKRSDTELRATVPPGARTGPVRVITRFGVATSEATFFVAPEVHGFTPVQAPEGFTVAIRGINFTGATDVAFGGHAATFMVTSDSLIRAQVPSGATSGPITVTAPGGSATSAEPFTVGPIPPGAVNLSWNECGAAGVALATFACNGVAAVRDLVASFDPPPGVEEFMGLKGRIRLDLGTLTDWWRHGAGKCRGENGLAASVDFQGRSACLDPWRGNAQVQMSYGIASHGPHTASIDIDASMPFERRVPLESGREHYGFKVQVRTSNPSNCAGCQMPARLTLEHVQLVQPAAAAFDPILTTPLQRKFVEWQGAPAPPPVIAYTRPAAGAPGDAVRIVGERLGSASRLTFRHGFFFNDQSVPFVVESDSVLLATVPELAITSAWEVTTIHGTGAGPVFIVAPRVENLVPRQAHPGEAVRVIGENMVGTTEVRFGDLPAEFVVRGNRELEAIVPLGAPEAPIRVTNPGGTGQSSFPFVVGPSIAGGINLAWDDCGRAGIDVKTFACDAGAGEPFTLVGSFVPPSGIFEFAGAAATLEVTSESAALPDWWRMSSGACRSGALSSGFDFTGDAWQACLDYAQGRAAGGHAYDVEVAGPNTARLRVTWAVPSDARGALTPGSEYYGFQVQIARDGAEGAGSCSGCDVPVEIALREIQLFQPPERGIDPVLRTPLVNTNVRWQGSAGSNLGPNLAHNSSFEQSTQGWRTVGNATLDRVPEGVHGEWSARITAHPDSTGSFGLNDSPDTVPFRSGVLGRGYRFEARVRSPGTGVRAQLRIREYAWGSRARLQTTVSSWVPLTSGWQPLTADLTALGQWSMLDFQVICESSAPGALVNVDDVKIRVIASRPVITAPDVVSAVPGTPYAIDVTAVDPSGAPVTSMSADYDGLHAHLATGAPGVALLRFTPEPEEAGYSYWVKVRATSVFTAERTIRIDVVPAPPDLNLVSNPSFEQDLFGWRTYEGSSISRVPNGRVGQWAMQVAGHDTAKKEFGVNDSPNWIRDTGPGPQARRYLLTAWVRAVNGGGRAHWKVREYKDGTLAGIDYSQKFELGPDWRRVAKYYHSQAPGSFLDVQLGFTKAGANAAFLVDDVMIRDVTPPALAKPAEATSASGGDHEVAFARPVVFPTPYRDRATLAMTLPVPGKVTVELFDLHGRRVKRIADRELEAGTHRFDLDRRGDDGERLGAGMYFYRVRGAVVANGRVVMLD